MHRKSTGRPKAGSGYALAAASVVESAEPFRGGRFKGLKTIHIIYIYMYWLLFLSFWLFFGKVGTRNVPNGPCLNNAT